MTWHDIADPASHRLDELAANYSLHQLHVEDCRQSASRIKVESGGQYLFIALKLLDLEQSNKLGVEDLVLFVGSDFLITVHSSPVDLLKPLRGLDEKLRPDQVLYQVMDAVVDSYLPVIDKLEDSIEKLHDQAVGSPRPIVLERISEIRSTLMQLRRVLSNTRHVAFQLRYVSTPFIYQELSPFLRDVHDDLALILTRLQRSASAWQVYWRFICQASPTAPPRLHGPLLSVRNCCITCPRYHQFVRNEHRLSILDKVALDAPLLGGCHNRDHRLFA